MTNDKHREPWPIPSLEELRVQVDDFATGRAAMQAYINGLEHELRARLTPSAELPMGDPHPCDMTPEELERFLAPSHGGTMQVTDEMVSRFLAWQLPGDFAPDGGVTFTKPAGRNSHLSWPIGTNLLTADQARQMLEHVLGAGNRGSDTSQLGEHQNPRNADRLLTPSNEADIPLLYKQTRLDLFGFYDDCDEEHKAALLEMGRRLKMMPSARVSVDLSSYINAADISASDMPHTVVEKLQRAINATESTVIDETAEVTKEQWDHLRGRKA